MPRILITRTQRIRMHHRRELQTALMRAINRVVRASVAHSWRYGGDPAAVPDIECEKQRAFEKLYAAIDVFADEIEKAATPKAPRMRKE